jgi:hypothetical protein
MKHSDDNYIPDLRSARSANWPIRPVSACPSPSSLIASLASLRLALRPLAAVGLEKLPRCRSLLLFIGRSRRASRPRGGRSLRLVRVASVSRPRQPHRRHRRGFELLNGRFNRLASAFPADCGGKPEGTRGRGSTTTAAAATAAVAVAVAVATAAATSRRAE